MILSIFSNKMLSKVKAGDLMIMLCLISIVTGCGTQDKESSGIRQVINQTFDRPDAKVVIEPIVVSDNYAIADWSQGEKAGRALLKMQGGEWKLWACGGKGLKDVNGLIQLGVPRQASINLSSKLSASENKLNREQVKRFDDFGPAVNFSTDTSSHHHH